MVSPLSLVILISTLLLQLHLTYGSSLRPPPLKRLAHPNRVSLQVLPRSTLLESRSSLDDSWPADSRRVRHTDSLRITVHAYSDIFHLHVQPNDDLIHPAASVKYYATKGQSSVLNKVVPLLRESYLLFGGEVIDDDSTAEKLKEDIAGGIRRPHHSPHSAGHRGWARIMVLDGGDPMNDRPPVFEGAFSVDGVVHHVLTAENYRRTKYAEDPEPIEDSEMVIFRDSDIMSHLEAEVARTGRPVDEALVRKPQTCAHDRLGYNVQKSNPVLQYGASIDPNRRTNWLDPLGVISPDDSSAYNHSLGKRQGDIGGGGNSSSNFVGTIGQTAGCPTTQQIIYMGVVSDCTYTLNNGGNTNATQNILRNFNTVSLLYKATFNISLGIVELQISDQSCPANDTNNPWNVACGSLSLNERLSRFSAWRGAKFSALSDQSSDPTGLWHLMSGCPSGTEVGVAWLGTVCQQRATGNSPSVVSGTGVSTSGRTEWQVVAHEIGHNLGAIHDCTDGCSLSDNCCPRSSSQCSSSNQFLMNPTSSSSEQVFSPCTIGNICSMMRGSGVDTSCINPPDLNQRTFSLQMCGNGIVEAGEECDPGAGADSACCDPATCKFRDNAVCDPMSSSCCSSTCQFAPAGQVCRPAKDAQCDIAETCTGRSGECPADQTSPNGQSCGSGGLACAMGTCTSISQQCRTVGASLNLTTACPSTSSGTCQISCQDPRNPSQCVVLNSQLIDGSPCGYGGTCLTGNCQAGTFLQTAVAWYTQNLQISIPVTVVVGIVVLVILVWIFKALRSCCTRKKDKKVATRATSQIPPTAPVQRLQSWPPGVPPGVAAGPFNVPPQRVRRNGSGGSGSAPEDSRRPSNSSDRQRPSRENNRTRPNYPLQPSYARDTTWQGNGAGNGAGNRNLMDEREGWVDERVYNGPRG